MYYLSVEVCKLIMNVIAHPWECLTRYDPIKMCDDLRGMFDDLGTNLYFDFVAHPVMVKDGLVYRAFLSVMSKDPKVVLGIVSHAVLKDMVLTLYFTDEFGDIYALNSVSFRTTGTEGMTMDTMGMVI